MMRRFGLRDDQWERIKDLLPGREGSVGVTAADNRLFVEAVLYRYRTGMPWRDLPERFGDGVQVHRRFSRWAESGVWERVFHHLAADADNEYAMIGWVWQLRLTCPTIPRAGGACGRNRLIDDRP
jgi:transposase